MVYERKYGWRFFILLLSILGLTCTKVPDPLEGWGNKVTLTTGNPSSPITTSVQITNSSVSCNVSPLTGKERGICWSESNSNVSVTASKAASGSGTGSFNATLTNLLPGRTYYYSSYVIISPPSAALYGPVLSFSVPATCPTLNVLSASSISYTAATISGGVVSDGGAPVTARGIVISNTNTNPTIGAGTDYPSGSGIGTYSVNLTGLTPATTYYARAYAVNTRGTCYGTTIQFTTAALTCPPTTTNNVTSIGTNSAVTGGNVTADGGSAVTAKGVVISSTNTTPSIGSGTNYPGGSGVGPFTTNLTGLTPGVTYYVRAYATNSRGTCYGSTVQFTTSPVCPTVSTSNMVRINSTTAQLGGNVTSDGGAPVTARGVIINGTSYTISGTGTGPFSSNFSGFQAGVSYNVRAFATNSAGTCTGSPIVFTW